MRKDLRFLLTLVAVALALRLFRIGTQSLWIDEIFTLNVSNPQGDLHIWDYLKYNIHGALHSFIVYIFHFVSMNDGWLRVPSALAGAATILYFYRWVELWLGRRVARIGSVILALNPLHIYYSQEIRNYSLLLMFGMMATFYLHRSLREENRRNLAAYTLSIAATALCSFTAAFLYAAHALIFLFRRSTTWRRIGRWVVLSILIAVLMSPWLYRIYVVIDFGKLADPVMPGDIPATERLRGETTFSMIGVPYAFYAFSTGFSLGPSLRELHRDTSVAAVMRGYGWLVAAVAVLFGALSVAGVRRLLLAAGPRSQLLIYILVPFALTLLLNWQNAKAFNVRYVLFAMPAYICVLALGIDSFRPRARILFTILVLLTSAVSLGNYYFNGRYGRENIRGAVSIVERDITPSECVVAPSVFEVFEHYFSKPNPVHPVFAAQRVPRESVDRQLARVFAECDGIWYVRAREWAGDPNGYIFDALERRFERVQTNELHGVTILRYAPGHLHH